MAQETSRWTLGTELHCMRTEGLTGCRVAAVATAARGLAEGMLDVGGGTVAGCAGPSTADALT